MRFSALGEVVFMSPQPTNITMAMVPEARSHNRAFPINGFTRMRYKQTTLAQFIDLHVYP